MTQAAKTSMLAVCLFLGIFTEPCLSADNERVESLGYPAVGMHDCAKSHSVWRAGYDYNVLLPDKPLDQELAKVELLELSMYTTYSAYPAAAAFRPALKKWLKEHEGLVVYRREPSIAMGMEHAKLQARIFFAFRGMDRDDLQEKFDGWIADPSREPIFHKIWTPDEKHIYSLTLQFVRGNGIEEDTFQRMYRSESVGSEVHRMLIKSAWAKMDGSPTFVIDERFSASAQRLAYPNGTLRPKDFDALLCLIDHLVNISRVKRTAY